MRTFTKSFILISFLLSVVACDKDVSDVLQGFDEQDIPDELQGVDHLQSFNGKVITTILGTGLNINFNATDEQIESSAVDMKDAGFTMSWDASPIGGSSNYLLNSPDFFDRSRKVRETMREHGIGIAFGFRWRRLRPNDVDEFKGEELNPETGEFVKSSDWNYGSSQALVRFIENTSILLDSVGPIEMFYSDENILGTTGSLTPNTQRVSTYWTSPTYSLEALISFRQYLQEQNYINAEKAKFPVTTVEIATSTDANAGLPAIRIDANNNERLVEDNNWPNSELWKRWYDWRVDIYTEWLGAITTIAFDKNNTNPNWMGCYYEMPVHWMRKELGQNIEKIVRLPHIDYILAGYTTGSSYPFVKEVADAVGKKWGLQIEISRFNRSSGLSLEFIENTFKNSVNDGASIVTCYAGQSFRTDLPFETVSDNRKQNGWYFMPEQVATWKNNIEWLEKGEGVKRPIFD